MKKLTYLIGRLWVVMTHRLLKRWARYEVISDCYLPIAERYSAQSVELYERKKTQDAYLESGLIRAWAIRRNEDGNLQAQHPIIKLTCIPNYAVGPINLAAKIVWWGIPLYLGPNFTPGLGVLVPATFYPIQKIVKQSDRARRLFVEKGGILDRPTKMYDFEYNEKTEELKREIKMRFDKYEQERKKK